MTTETAKGFDPTEHLIGVRDKRGKDYLPVAARVLWFRTEHPEGIITPELVQLDDERGFALFRATVRMRVGEEEWAEVTDYGSSTRKGFEFFIEKAVTKAIGRALALLGYGTLAAFEDGDEAAGHNLADTPHQPARRPQPAATLGIADAPLPRPDAKPVGKNEKGVMLWRVAGLVGAVHNGELLSRDLCSAHNVRYVMPLSGPANWVHLDSDGVVCEYAAVPA